MTEEQDSSISSSVSTIVSTEAEGNPNLRLTSVLLNEYNYFSWSRAISLALGGKSKLGHINGSVQPPEQLTPTYEVWLAKDLLVMSWLLNSMEPAISDIFSFSESALDLWKAVEEMYGNQNNAARVFQLQKDISNLQQEGNSFIQHLGRLKSKWNELNIYRPHTTVAKELRQRAEEDKIFQLLASLGPEYEDLRSHILMSSELPTLTSICSTIQREEVRRKVMNADTKATASESKAFASNSRSTEHRVYKGKRPDLWCTYCEHQGHLKDTCWILHPELKPKFDKEQRFSREAKSFQKKPTPSHTFKANHAAANDGLVDFTTNPTALINEFAAYLQLKKVGNESNEEGNKAALLGKFAGFLAETDGLSQDEIPGILNAFSTALNVNTMHDFWIIDSGATDHMTNKNSNLHEFEKFSKPSTVSVANGKGVAVLGKGKINLLSKDIESTALYVPSFPFQLLSVGRITNSVKCIAIFYPHKVVFQDLATSKVIGEGFYLNGLYYLSKSLNVPRVFQTSLNQDQEHKLWHQRLAHPSETILSTLFPSFCKSSLICEICQLAKFAKLPFDVSLSRASKMFQIVHSDIWGPAPLDSWDGYKYFATFVDDYSRVTWVYLLKFKSDLLKVFQDFHNLVMNIFSSKIHILRSDNGTEYMSKNMTQYMSNHGIIHQTSCVGTPQQNGIAERKNRDLLNKTRALLFQMNVPKKFWSQGILTATHLINRLPSRVLHMKSPFEIMKGRKSELSHLRIFGCVCYVHIQAIHRDKLDAKAAKCVFLGYSTTQKGYKCYNPKTRKLVVSRDVRFDESSPFFSGPEVST